ncbi:class E sortase [Streptomyces sp. DW26H14]|uniref:class E sortase n=1 Tax=Streptomyces sp. DW26H14 TaxID=3435395 RepID=UPI00403DC049
MTALRPEHEGETGASYEPQGAPEDDEDVFEAVVGGLADPLTDPIPGAPRAAGRTPARAPLPPEAPAPAPGASAARTPATAPGRTGAPAGGRDAGPPAAPDARAGGPVPPGAAPGERPARPERPAGKHARQSAAPVPGTEPVPPGGITQPPVPARHAVRPRPAATGPAAPGAGTGALAYPEGVAPAPAPPPGRPPVADAATYPQETPPAAQPAGPPASAPMPDARATVPDARAAAHPPETPPRPATGAAPLPPFSDAEQTLISPPLGSTGAPAAPRPPRPSQSAQSHQNPAQAPAARTQAPQAQTQAAQAQTQAPQAPQAVRAPQAPQAPVPVPSPLDQEAVQPDQETVALRTADVRRAVGADEPAGGRAERRKAAKAGARGRKRPQAAAEAAPRPPGRPLTRVEARQAARALKDSPGVVVSRAVGELFITFGVLMLLFVTYSLWWTNVRADNYRSNEASKMQNAWKSQKGPAAGAFEPGQGFAIIHIPKLDVVAPIAQGVSTEKVLDHGEVGHYSEGALKTAMPEDKTGNFALAGHRNTHGEPFRYINRLVPGDKVVVETQDEYYTYEMTRTLPQTTAANVGVISPIPQGSGFTKPGRYITLTTCTPEFTSTYRLIVWGKMVSEQPRNQGLPAALQHH